MGKVVEFPQAGRSRASKPLWRHVLGEVLRGERLDQQRILTEVAATAGVSPQYLSEIERGRKEPSSEVLGSVADALGLHLYDVVHRVGDRLDARRADELRDAERRELLVIETAQAFRAGPGHPLDLHDVDAAFGAPAGSVSQFDAFLLAA